MTVERVGVVVLCPELRVTEVAVGFLNLLKLGSVTPISIRMIFCRLFAVGFFDVVWSGVFGQC